jgi:hypothetical protein
MESGSAGTPMNWSPHGSATGQRTHKLQQLAQIPGRSIFEIVAENGALIIGHKIRERK